jgi:hypothetical protein
MRRLRWGGLILSGSLRASKMDRPGGLSYWTMTMGARQKANFWACGSNTLT